MKKSILYALIGSVSLVVAQNASALVHFDNDIKGSVVKVTHLSPVKGRVGPTRVILPNKLVSFNCPYKYNTFRVTVHRQTLPYPVLATCRLSNLPSGTVVKGSDILNGVYRNCWTKQGMF